MCALPNSCTPGFKIHVSVSVRDVVALSLQSQLFAWAEAHTAVGGIFGVSFLYTQCFAAIKLLTANRAPLNVPE